MNLVTLWCATKVQLRWPYNAESLFNIQVGLKQHNELWLNSHSIIHKKCISWSWTRDWAFVQWTLLFNPIIPGQWRGINRKQSTRWQHLSRLKTSAFFSFQKKISCYETHQRILETGTAIWWVTEPHCKQMNPIRQHISKIILLFTNAIPNKATNFRRKQSSFKPLMKELK